MREQVGGGGGGEPVELRVGAQVGVQVREGRRDVRVDVGDHARDQVEVEHGERCAVVEEEVDLDRLVEQRAVRQRGRLPDRGRRRVGGHGRHPRARSVA
ncbi:hypothetical protein D9M69_709810 [compost metagenome]